MVVPSQAAGVKIGESAKREAVVVQEIADCLDYCVTNFQNRVLPPRPQPEMAMIHQKLSAVFLRRDRIVVDFVENFGVNQIDFVAAGRAAVFPDRAADRKRRFLSQAL